MLIFAERRDRNRRCRQFFIPGELLSVVTRAPNLPCRKISIDVCAIQFWKLLAVINDPTSQRPKLRVRMLDRRLDNLPRPPLAVEINRRVAFVDPPAVIL